MSEANLALAESPRDFSGAMSIEEKRAIAEVQASMVIAKRFPRDVSTVLARVKIACQRRELAEKAHYAYKRGGENITGPSVHLLRTVAQCYGNLDFGFRELAQEAGRSIVEAFAWDKESNTREVRAFQVPHSRFTRAAGNTPLVDPRDIYEMVANQAARRERACLENVIPRDIILAASDECKKTLAEGGAKGPFVDRVRKLVAALSAEFAVTPEQVAEYLGHLIDATNRDEFANLYAVYQSLRDGEAKVAEFFGPSAKTQQDGEPKGGAAKIKAMHGKAKEEAPSAPAHGEAAEQNQSGGPGQQSIDLMAPGAMEDEPLINDEQVKQVAKLAATLKWGDDQMEPLIRDNYQAASLTDLTENQAVHLLGQMNHELAARKASGSAPKKST